MENVKQTNIEKVKYFDVREYVERIKVSKENLEYADYIAEDFEKYLKTLSEYPNEVILDYLVRSFKEEIRFSNLMENHKIEQEKMENCCHNPEIIKKGDIYLDPKIKPITHKNIEAIHKYAYQNDKNLEEHYRTKEALHLGKDNYHKEVIPYWYGAEPADIKRFMNDFISYYKTPGVQQKHDSIFIKPALCHLLFLRIHPFNDGNSRTARLIQDMKFRQMINEKYHTRLEISPLHMSMSLYNFQLDYSERINNIYFGLEHDANKEINDFISFMLRRFEDQLFFFQNHQYERMLQECDAAFQNRQAVEKLIEDNKVKAKVMRINSLVQRR